MSPDADPDFAARSARDADVADGLVPAARWEDLDQAERNTYRRAVEGLGYQSGIPSINRERWRQIRAHNFFGPHDDAHTDSELVAAAIAYATVSVMQQTRADAAGMLCGHPPPTSFGWPAGWTWHPEPTSRENLIKAGALIAAELDRLARAEGMSDW